jgi:hypothetical protein
MRNLKNLYTISINEVSSMKITQNSRGISFRQIATVDVDTPLKQYF